MTTLMLHPPMNLILKSSDESHLETPQRAPIQDQINAPITETAPVITTQKTPSLPINSDKLSEIKANMMTVKSIFYELTS